MFITSNIYSQIDNDYMMKNNKTNKTRKIRNKIPSGWKFEIAVAKLSQIIVKKKNKTKKINQNYLISNKFNEH